MLTHGWFAWVYWTALAVGVISVVLALIDGRPTRLIVNGAVVMAGVVSVLIAKHLVDRRRDRADDR